MGDQAEAAPPEIPCTAQWAGKLSVLVGPGSSILPLQTQQYATVLGQGCPQLSHIWQGTGVPEHRGPSATSSIHQTQQLLGQPETHAQMSTDD